MRFLDWLFRKTPKVADPIPETDLVRPGQDRPPQPDNDPDDMIPDDNLGDEIADEMADIFISNLTFSSEDAAVSGPHKHAAQNRVASEPLENFFCHIDYKDAGGKLTTRPVTLMSLQRRETGLLISAVCHLRRSLRTFRADRIVTVVTADGEVFDGPRFLQEILGLTLEPSAAPHHRVPSRRKAKNGQKPLRSVILAPLTVLVACGKADGHFHPEEVDRILAWAEREAMHLHRAGVTDADMTIEEADSLAKAVGSMRPQARTLRRHILATLSMPDDSVTRFRAALRQVIDADGLLHDAEILFMQEFDELIGMSRSTPQKAIDEVTKAAGLREAIEIRQ
ncbi:hypothetical protein [Paracoccus denitrificans]|uniref:WYL domain-containing protein n=1 Tax=Paracoccus denitrificans TaxID=266 RepID=UPI003365055A